VRRVALHLLFGVLISLLQLVAYNFVFQTLVRRSSDSFFPLGPFQDVVVGQFHFNLLLYAVIVGLYQTFDYYRRFREREQRATQLEVEAGLIRTSDLKPGPEAESTLPRRVINFCAEVKQDEKTSITPTGSPSCVHG
jgi:hypothetical protein